MKTFAIFIVYVIGFMFSLGFHLEDCQGQDMAAPFWLSIFWPVIAVIAFPFSAGIRRAEMRRASTRRRKK